MVRGHSPANGFPSREAFTHFEISVDGATTVQEYNCTTDGTQNF